MDGNTIWQLRGYWLIPLQANFDYNFTAERPFEFGNLCRELDIKSFFYYWLPLGNEGRVKSLRSGIIMNRAQ